MRAHELCEDDRQDDYIEKCRTFLKAWKLIRRDCSDILNIYKSSKTFLIRGIAADLPEIWRGHSTQRPEERGERREEVDEWLARHGFEALRGNSVFCANSIDQAFKYAGETGRKFYIFPMNGFKYTWYQDTHDLYQLNFNKTLSDEGLTIDELMSMAQPRHDGIEEMLGTYRFHELHFIGSYWAIDREFYGHLALAEISGQGIMARARYMPDDVRAKFGLKPLKRAMTDA